MSMPPIISALRRHKAGVILIALQIALTLAIVTNAVYIIDQRVERVNRATGIDESNLLLVQQAWVDAPDDQSPIGVIQLDAMLREDIDALRRLPDVASVAATSTLPLLNMANNNGISLSPEQKKPTSRVSLYFGDENLIDSLGLRLVAGRAFTAADVVRQGLRDTGLPPIVIVTKLLADKLFPRGNALGKIVYIGGDTHPLTIVGIVERLQSPTTKDWAEEFAYNSAIVPVRRVGFFSLYAIRTRAGREDTVRQAVGPALYAVNPLRVFGDGTSARSFAEIRRKAYRDDYGMMIMMAVVCLILIGTTAAGIVGLTSFWVGQRTHQIGVRRALGARKVDILRYFQVENLLIAGGGTLIGAVLALALNLWLVTHFEMSRMPMNFLVAGMIAVLVLGQAAVLSPARRAANVPPVVATRSI
jgi:putative ABC transport system permease protein